MWNLLWHARQFKHEISAIILELFSLFIEFKILKTEENNNMFLFLYCSWWFCSSQRQVEVMDYSPITAFVIYLYTGFGFWNKQFQL